MLLFYPYFGDFHCILEKVLGKRGLLSCGRAAFGCQIVFLDGSEWTVEVTTYGMWVNEHWEGLADWEANIGE